MRPSATASRSWKPNCPIGATCWTFILTGTFIVSQQVARHMVERGQGGGHGEHNLNFGTPGRDGPHRLRHGEIGIAQLHSFRGGATGAVQDTGKFGHADDNGNARGAGRIRPGMKANPPADVPLNRLGGALRTRPRRCCSCCPPGADFITGVDLPCDGGRPGPTSEPGGPNPCKLFRVGGVYIPTIPTFILIS